MIPKKKRNRVPTDPIVGTNQAECNGRSLGCEDTHAHLGVAQYWDRDLAADLASTPTGQKNLAHTFVFLDA